MRNSILLLMVVLFASLQACQEQPFYQKSYSFKNNTWSRKNKPTFKVHISDTSKAYNFVLSLRTSTHYAYNNIWMYLNTKTPDKQHVREPFQLKLADEKGYWLGKKTGTIVENHLVFKERKFPKKGDYIFVLEQGITKKVIYNVLDISLEIQEVK